MRHKVHSASPDIITLERFLFEFLQNVNVSPKFKQGETEIYAEKHPDDKEWDRG